jgi:hypothetical protein
LWWVEVEKFVMNKKITAARERRKGFKMMD